MKFGVRAADEVRNVGSGDFIRNFKQGDTRLRFLEEMDDWTVYYEHFNKAQQRSYPCTGERESCPGCVEYDRLKEQGEEPWGASRRYLVNALDPDSGYVNLYKVPVSVIDDLSRYSDKDGTITARDYTIVRIKKDDGKIAYSVDREEKDPGDLSIHEKHMKDHQQALTEAYVEAWGEQPGDEAPPTKKAAKRVAKKKLDPKVEAAARETMEEPKKPAKKAAAKLPTEDDDPPSEPAGETEQDAQRVDDDEEEVDEDDLRKMSPGEIKALFKQCGLNVPDSNDVDVLVDRLISELG